jgi:hypothetical protein
MTTKTVSRTRSKAQSERGSALRSTVRSLGNLIASPANTVNTVMQWLNENMGLSLPVLPLFGWPASLYSLWELFILGEVPPGPLPWSIEVEGSWPAIFPQTGSPPLTLNSLTIHVEEKP